MSKSILILLAAMLFAGYAAVAQDNDSEFKWSHERGTPDSTEATAEPGADEADRLAAENLELKKRLDEAYKASADLEVKISRLERDEKTLRAKIEELENAETEPAVDFVALNTARAENEKLQQQIDELKADLRAAENRQATQKTPSAAAVQDSALFKKMQEDNAELQKRNALLYKQLENARKANEKESEEVNDVIAANLRQTAEIAKLKEEIAEFKEENRMLTALQKNLSATTMGLLEAEQEPASPKPAATDRQQAQLKRAEETEVELRRRLVTREREVAQYRRQLREAERDVKKLQKTLASRRTNLAKAEKKTKSALQKQANSHFNMAVLYVRTGLHKEAEKEFLDILRLDSTAPDVHYNLAILYDRYLNDKRKAVKHYERYLELAPHSADAKRVKIWLMEAEMEI